MTFGELMAVFRDESGDIDAPFVWSKELIKMWLNEAQKEACIRARLLHESANAEICQIAVTAGASVYPLHALIYEIDYMAFVPTGDARRYRVKQISREDLDALRPDWRERTGRPDYAIQDDTGIRLAFTPDAAGTLHIEGFRLPSALVSESDEPEINPAHHEKLIHWVLHRAFSRTDTEIVDPARAAKAYADFSSHFGQSVDADLRRTTRQDVMHHNTAFWV